MDERNQTDKGAAPKGGGEERPARETPGDNEMR